MPRWVNQSPTSHPILTRDRQAFCPLLLLCHLTLLAYRVANPPTPSLPSAQEKLLSASPAAPSPPQKSCPTQRRALDVPVRLFLCLSPSLHQFLPAALQKPQSPLRTCSPAPVMWQTAAQPQHRNQVGCVGLCNSL